MQGVGVRVLHELLYYRINIANENIISKICHAKDKKKIIKFSSFIFEIKMTGKKFVALCRWSVFSYILLIPWTIIFFPFSPHDYGRIIQVWVLAGCMVALAMTTMRDRLKLSGTAILMFAILCASVSVSAVTSSHPAWAWREVALFSSLIAATLLLGMDRKPITDVILRVAVISFAFYGILELLVVNLGLMAHLAVPAGDFAIGYDNPRFFNHVATVALPLCATAAVSDDQRWIRRSAWSALMIGFSLTLYTGGRAVLVGDTAAILALMALLGRRSWSWVRAAITGVLAGALLYGIQFLALPWMMDLPAWTDWAGRLGDKGSVSSRLVLWRDSMKAWIGSPLFGIGPMHFAHFPNSDAAHPHNIYLQILCEWGLLPFIFIVALISIAFSCVITKLREKDPMEHRLWLQGAGFLAATAAGLIDGCFSGNFVMPVSQMWIMVAAGGLLNWWRHARIAQYDHAAYSHDKGFFLSGPIVLALTIVVVLAAGKASQDFLNLKEVLNQSSRQSISERMNPRFWSEGWF